MVGQSFSSLQPRYGKIDLYPETGTFTTSAQAEGALEGTADMYRVNDQATFLCDDDVVLFPYDSSECSFTLVGEQTVTHFDGSLGFEIADPDRDFHTYGWIEEDDMEDDSVKRSRVHFRLCYRRVTMGYNIRLVVPAVLLNAIGFMSFWIDSAGESIALGITSLLCMLALRQSVQLPDTSQFTWVELFLLFNVIFQSFVLLLGFMDYSAAIRNRVKVVTDPINSGLERLSRTVKRGRLALKAPKQEVGDARVESVDDGDDKPPGLMATGALADDEKKEEKSAADVLGRYLIVPSYFLLLALICADEGRLVGRLMSSQSLLTCPTSLPEEGKDGATPRWGSFTDYPPP